MAAVTSLQKRKSHNKSRRGCQNCKKRHVKCDEQGPPCANCIARKCGHSCVYIGRSPSESHSSHNSVSPTRGSPMPIINERDGNFSPSRYLLDMELLHHWSTHTCVTMMSVQEDLHYLQVEIPRIGLQEGYLLKATLCAAALEKAALSGDTEQGKNYLRTAMDYYDEASAAFRGKLENVTHENSHYLYMMAMFQGTCQMALPQFRAAGTDSSMLDFICALFKMYINGAKQAITHWDWLMDSPLTPSLVSAIEIMKIAPDYGFDYETTSAIARLDRVIDSTYTDNLADYDGATIYRSNKVALSALKMCYVECSKKKIHAFAIAFPFAAGRLYSKSITNREPAALYILMHWGVLLHELGCVSWWAATLGSSLVTEIADLLEQEQSSLASIPEWHEGIQTCRDQVAYVRCIDMGSEGPSSGILTPYTPPIVPLSNDTSREIMYVS